MSANPFPPSLPPPPQDEFWQVSKTTCILIKKKPMWFIGVEVKIACTQMLFYFSFHFF